MAFPDRMSTDPNRNKEQGTAEALGHRSLFCLQDSEKLPEKVECVKQRESTPFSLHTSGSEQ